jgi:integrase
MARPLKPVGTHGKVWVTAKPSGGWTARTKYRDHDGIVRLVERTGRTSSAARNALLTALQERAGTTGDDITGETRFQRAAELWIAEVRAAGERGDLSPSTVELYERQLRNHILRSLGALRLREVTTPRVNAFLGDLRGRFAVSTVRTCRSVISGVMRLAVTHGAALTNPTREVRIPKERRRPPRALTAEERVQWLSMLETDPIAVRKDLPDLTRWMLATGVRIGEALAVSWNEINMDAQTVLIEWNLIRIRGEGLRRVPRVKTDSGERTLPLPSFAMDMLRRRALTCSRGPLFPDSVGGWRDPSNTRRDLRTARGTHGFAWVTSHVFRKTCATILDEAGLSARAIADQLGHSRPSLTQDVYLGRKALGRTNAHALDKALDTKSTR